MTPGSRHPNKSFPSVISLSLWLILRKILKTSWLVLWPRHLGVQVADRFISGVPLSVRVIGNDTAELCKWGHSNFSQISLGHLTASLPLYLRSISLSGSRKGLCNRKRGMPPWFSYRSTNGMGMWPSDILKGKAVWEGWACRQSRAEGWEEAGMRQAQELTVGTLRPVSLDVRSLFRGGKRRSMSDRVRLLTVLTAMEWPRTSHVTSLGFRFPGPSEDQMRSER